MSDCVEACAVNDQNSERNSDKDSCICKTGFEKDVMNDCVEACAVNDQNSERVDFVC